MKLTRLRTILMVLMAALIMSGCTVKLVYNNLDIVVPWYLSDLVTIKPNQQEKFDASMNRILQWHRQTQLPKYSTFLNQVSKEINQGLTPAQIENHYQQIDGLMNDLFWQVGQTFTPLLVEMDLEQTNELIENLTERNQEYAEEFVFEDEQTIREARRDKVEDLFDSWLGELTDPQIAMIDSWSQNFHLIGAGFYESRQKWQQHFQQLLISDQPRAQKQQAFLKLFSQRKQFWSAKVHADFEFNKRLMMALIYEISQTLSNEQTYYLTQRLQNYSEDFQELSLEKVISPHR